MRSLLELGRLDSLEAAAAAFTAAIEQRNFFDPANYKTWCQRILVDHPQKQALILPPDAVLDGDLYLDGDADDAVTASISTILALGNLTITGRIYNESSEDGDFLLVGGHLQTFELIKGAANIVVLGALTATTTVFCDFCPGALVTGGDVTTPLLLSNDHDVRIGGQLNGHSVTEEDAIMRDVLVPEVFADPGDLADEWPDSALVRAHLAAGLPVLKTEGA